MSTRRIARRQSADRASSESLRAERLLESPRGRRLLDACGGDVEHALRIVDVLGEVPPIASSSSSPDNVIRLPRLEPFDWLEADAIPKPKLEVRAAWIVAGALGLTVWVGLAALAFGIYELVEWLR